MKKKLELKTFNGFLEKYKEKLPRYIQTFLTNEQLEEMYSPRSSQKRGMCVIKASREVRELIKFRMDRLGLTPNEVESRTGISRARITIFFNTPTRVSLSQSQILMLADIVGINLNIQWEINPYFTKKDMQKKLKQIDNYGKV